MSDSNAASYDQVRDRLDEIVEAVSAPGISLDEALALYEEAVKLGLSACDLSEEGAEELLAEDIRFCIFTQYLFFRQWNALRAYIRKQGIRIIGDVPIYVPLDSPVEGEAAVARQDEATPAAR